MKILFLIFMLLFTLLSTKLAGADAGLLQGVNEQDLRTGDIHIEDLGNILKGAIDFMMAIAGTVAVIAIIIGAYHILFGSITEGSRSKGKEYIVGALIGFGIAALSWFFVRLIIDNF